ncbi:MAG: ZPR1 zinc finger domain-containing protein [Nanoarchaeota archaeon]|nr:ZPR1 zinc finger domain-containing protein [Nanoarchaeota archaeon]
MDKLENQPCPICGEKKCTLLEEEIDIPFFGKTFAFGMDCSACGFHMSDVEAADEKDPVKITFVVENKNDLKARVVKSAKATLSIPTLRVKISPGSGSEGYVSNIEGVLKRLKIVVEKQRDAADDKDVKKKAKNLLKKIWKIECGDMPMKIIIEDLSGNSAIISEKAEVIKLKKKKK